LKPFCVDVVWFTNSIRRVDWGVNRVSRLSGRVVCLFGADGSGKTTIARFVSAYLRRKGISVQIAWLRGTHTLASIIARFLSTFPAFRGPCNPYYSICIPKKLRRIWIWLELISILPVVLMRLVLPRILGKTVIAERSPLDLLVWLTITLQWSGTLRSLVIPIVVSLARSLCDRLVYVRASELTLLARRRGCREESVIPLELHLYDALARALGTPCIDTTNRPVSESVVEVLKILGWER